MKGNLFEIIYCHAVLSKYLQLKLYDKDIGLFIKITTKGIFTHDPTFFIEIFRDCVSPLFQKFIKHIAYLLQMFLPFLSITLALDKQEIFHDNDTQIPNPMYTYTENAPNGIVNMLQCIYKMCNLKLFPIEYT